MFNWLRELYEIRRENKLAVQCASCEVLKVELAAERREKQMLLHRILSPNEPTGPVVSIDKPQPIVRHKPWRVIQQELETRDKAIAEKIKKEFEDKTAVKTQPTTVSESVANMEKEMGITDAG